MNRWIWVFLTFLLIFLGVEILMFSPQVLEQFNEKSESVIVSQDVKKKYHQFMKGVHLVESKGGERDWELWAENAMSEDGKVNWKLQKVKIIFYKKNEINFVVTGEGGSIKTLSKDIEIHGNVMTKSLNGYEYKTDRVIYNPRGRELLSPQAVKMLGPPMKMKIDQRSFDLTGGHMVALLDDSSIRITQGIRAIKILEDGKIIHISSAYADFNGNNYYAKFFKNVIIDVEAIRITGPEALFNYQEGSDVLKSMFVNGGVKVSDRDKWAVSNEVQVSFDENKFTFRGDPRVVQNMDELKGEEIIFIDGGKKVKVLRAKARVDETTVKEGP